MGLVKSAVSKAIRNYIEERIMQFADAFLQALVEAKTISLQQVNEIRPFIMRELDKIDGEADLNQEAK